MQPSTISSPRFAQVILDWLPAVNEVRAGVPAAHPSMTRRSPVVEGVNEPAVNVVFVEPSLAELVSRQPDVAIPSYCPTNIWLILIADVDAIISSLVPAVAPQR